MDDNFKCIYKILTAFEKSLDVEEFDIANISAEFFGEKMTIQDFLNEHKDDFDVYEIRPDWNGYKVYSLWLKSNEGACVGYPRYALEKDEIIRESTLDETISIMDSDLRDESD